MENFDLMEIMWLTITYINLLGPITMSAENKSFGTNWATTTRWFFMCFYWFIHSCFSIFEMYFHSPSEFPKFTIKSSQKYLSRNANKIRNRFEQSAFKWFLKHLLYQTITHQSVFPTHLSELAMANPYGHPDMVEMSR